KCSGLAESSCFPLDNQTQPDGTVLGACFPQCRNDDDCASDMFCDTWSGLCVEDALPGKAPGEVCNLEAETDECGSGGGCVSIAEGIPTGFCTVSCNIHTDTLVCGDDEAGPDAKAVCFPHVQIADYFGTLSSVNDV